MVIGGASAGAPAVAAAPGAAAAAAETGPPDLRRLLGGRFCASCGFCGGAGAESDAAAPFAGSRMAF